MKGKAIRISKGCTLETKDGYFFDAEISIYNLGFYITIKERKDLQSKTSVEMTTRSTPQRAMGYLGREVIKRQIATHKLIHWKKEIKVIKDKETKLYKTIA